MTRQENKWQGHDICNKSFYYVWNFVNMWEQKPRNTNLEAFLSFS